MNCKDRFHQTSHKCISFFKKADILISQHFQDIQGLFHPIHMPKDVYHKDSMGSHQKPLKCDLYRLRYSINSAKWTFSLAGRDYSCRNICYRCLSCIFECVFFFFLPFIEAVHEIMIDCSNSFTLLWLIIVIITARR